LEDELLGTLEAPAKEGVQLDEARLHRKVMTNIICKGGYLYRFSNVKTDPSALEGQRRQRGFKGEEG